MQVVTKKTKCLRARIEVRPTALQSWLTPTLTLTSTFNPLQRDIVMTHTRAKVWVTDQSIQQVEGTNGRTDTTNCSTLSANADTDNSLVSVELGCLNRPRYFGRAPAPYLSHGTASRSPVLTRGGICVPPTVNYLPYRVSGSTLTAVVRSQLLARWPGTHSRILSGIHEQHRVFETC